MELQVGEVVTGIYKTGKYIGEITEIRPQHYLVRVLAVMKHPMQGDLHSPKDADVLIFHERRALSFREQANIPKQMVKPFENEVPEYMESLKEAVAKMKTELSAAGSEWAEMSLKAMETLEKDYKI
ncbi:kinase-associated lipoprotein B [Neobacillus sp. MM2021_6]|uniref:kinase-associated lipoprotein B n=1 Tax=Bacillaceae TaxID=186817 RepID=UPI00140C9810|nr:kinase-associated lipoprotein B [Neobacillus sp. OS1-2]MBO0958903.1 kinase-associated lipoprotein B [Neobacillus sp. MM2021_6]NHC17632.1 kinase [Bacillus sp. MM2020_4]WML41030.1 kinase-associated lipoprotein B [Neobacillus sp. OS1-2]